MAEATLEYGEWQRSKGILPIGARVSCYSSIEIERYNEETIALLQESVKTSADEIRTQRE